jgi:hypothetical protein
VSVAFLRIDVISQGDLDWALCSLGDANLERREDRTYLECPEALAVTAATLLARAGARAVAVAALTPPPATLVPARMADLAPLDATGVIDRVSVRVISAGEAARRSRTWPFRRARAEAGRVRAVLHGEDRAFEWRRIVWAERATLRSTALSRARPIVFDRAAVTGGKERRSYARDGALARWMVR